MGVATLEAQILDISGQNIKIEGVKILGSVKNKRPR
jgi:hypothetical protein